MSESSSHRPLVDARRLVHVVILLSVIVGIRACGGVASVEDQFGAGTQWVSEHIGLATAKEWWDKSIRPPVGGMTRAGSDSLYSGVSRILDRAEEIRNQGTTWLAITANRAADAIAGMFRGGSSPASEPAEPASASSPQPNN
jgi:hypothetical protein